MALIASSVAEKSDYIAARDAILPKFRQRICERMGIIPFEHQAAWWCLTEGLILTDRLAADDAPPDTYRLIQLPDKRTEKRLVEPRMFQGLPRHARFVGNLTAFKAGKSVSTAIWAGAFAIVPGAKIELVGLEYDTCSPEFEYLIEILLSARGFGLKATSVQNRPRDGKMWIDLDNGVQYIARSWERKEAMKGKERDAYIFSEAYMLPGLEVLTSNKQNLDARRGFAIFPTTPDRPWISSIHELGHDASEPDWACVCGVPRSVNPYAYDPEQAERDRRTMTKERYQIHYGGRIGQFVGSVFDFQQGERVFTPETHPQLWRNPLGKADPSNLRVPESWDVIAATDSGTFYSALFAAFDEFGHVFFVHEYANYRYVAGEIELIKDVSIPQWARRVVAASRRLHVRPYLWSDRQNQMKQELRRYGITIRSIRNVRETRTEITREYFKGGRVWLAPWLKVLPVEIEKAQWPENFDRVRAERKRKDDHLLDCAEHILVQRPIVRPHNTRTQHRRFIDEELARLRSHISEDPHGL